jgi:hypothetical protein
VTGSGDGVTWPCVAEAPRWMARLRPVCVCVCVCV